MLFFPPVFRARKKRKDSFHYFPETLRLNYDGTAVICAGQRVFHAPDAGRGKEAITTKNPQRVGNTRPRSRTFRSGAFFSPALHRWDGDRLFFVPSSSSSLSFVRSVDVRLGLSQETLQ